MTLSQPVKFVLCGGFTTCINLISRFFLSRAIPYAVAIVIAYVIGMVIGFFLFKHLVYASDKKNNVAKEVGKYLIVNASSLLVTLAVSILLKDSLFPYVGFLFQPEDTAHFIGVFLGAVSNYFGHKIFTFA